jgi:hypothetical protein
MSNISEIKFIRVDWNEYRQARSNQEQFSKGLDIAHAEMESKIVELLKQGWVLNGELKYLDSPDRNPRLVQSMVKYATPIQSNDLLDLSTPATIDKRERRRLKKEQREAHRTITYKTASARAKEAGVLSKDSDGNPLLNTKKFGMIVKEVRKEIGDIPEYSTGEEETTDEEREPEILPLNRVE